jgi:hypothetical protein
MRRTALFTVVAALHFGATIGLLLFVFGAGMSRFDTGGEPGWFEAACGHLLTVLGFPVLTFLDGRSSLRFPGLWGYVPFVANSALWGAALLSVAESVRRLGTRRPTTSTSPNGSHGEH